MRSLAYAEIHLAIGLAHVGDHPAAYFIGPMPVLERHGHTQGHVLGDTKHVRWWKSRRNPP